MYIHFVGRGNEVELAKGVREAIALTKSPFTSTASGPETKPQIAAEIEKIIGYQGSMGMHFWAHGDAIVLAKGLRAALDRIGS
jgi:hypothetical protein